MNRIKSIGNQITKSFDVLQKKDFFWSSNYLCIYRLRDFESFWSRRVILEIQAYWNFAQINTIGYSS